MPKGKTKKFIDKKNSVTFQLVHRSQRDPLAADENAPQRVLIPTGSKQAQQHSNTNSLSSDKRKEEQQKYGVFFDDEYDYLQHLKDVNTLTAEWEKVEPTNKVDVKKPSDKKNEIQLPSSVFESNVEEKVGLLNRAATSGLQLDLDPDIVAAMDDDFDFDDPDNELEDDFIQLANAEGGEDGSSEYSGEMSDAFESDEDADGSSCSDQTFGHEETKSRFTEYSMSSNIMKRNQGLTLLDDKFEQMYADYDENEIGPLDCVDIEGFVEPNSDVLLQCAQEHENKQKLETESISELVKKHMHLEDESEDYNKYLEKLSVDVRERNKWDCESVLSTYSNIYNHPKLIKESNVQKIKVDEKTGIPKDFSGGRDKNQLTVRNLSQFENENELSNKNNSHATKSVVSELTIRSKNETPEERKERKKNFKEYRRERRKERKINIEAFKQEKKRQENILNNERKTVKANRIL
ncbi:hypothetical protein TSAR_007434 [Trichomalopsis sarcophagae]|uniref:Protein LTV1 homolog n=1 Tax=Trichomalopsis sarcophagae TaxID=543379 RepID=A0A232FER1_9HYME|nr:hypothetical protein TSAR_007434 [Trichomalopsis sarcophagae]